VALLGFPREFDNSRLPLLKQQLLLATGTCQRLMQGKELPALGQGRS